MKNIRVFVYENFQFLEVKLSLYFNRRVFVISANPMAYLPWLSYLVFFLSHYKTLPIAQENKYLEMF